MALNQCSFIGNLAADPEVRTFSTGGKVCNLRIGVSERWKTKDGEQKERTEWVQIAIFQDGLIRIAEQYLRKGSKVFIQGKMQNRKWQDQSGADKYTTEIILQGFDGKLEMLDGKPSGGSNDGYQQQGGAPSGGAGRVDDMSDSIPFAPCIL